jgi:hypothetical protein
MDSRAVLSKSAAVAATDPDGALKKSRSASTTPIWTPRCEAGLRASRPALDFSNHSLEIRRLIDLIAVACSQRPLTCPQISSPQSPRYIGKSGSAHVNYLTLLHPSRGNIVRGVRPAHSRRRAEGTIDPLCRHPYAPTCDIPSTNQIAFSSCTTCDHLPFQSSRGRRIPHLTDTILATRARPDTIQAALKPVGGCPPFPKAVAAQTPLELPFDAQITQASI